jgi:hypothetical protein
MSEERRTPSTEEIAAAGTKQDPDLPAGDTTDDQSELLFAGDGEGYRDRWRDIQAEFVDHPRQAVEEADGLVAEIMQEVARVFAEERGRLESQWDQGEDANTEDLRVALTRYRSFFERLLAV